MAVSPSPAPRSTCSVPATRRGQRFDHNRIELVPEKKTYKPGETARIMIQSPWERATALVTTEREGIRTYRPFLLTSTQESISIPINGRRYSEPLRRGAAAQRPLEAAPSADAVEHSRPVRRSIEDPSDPGKPAFRLGYAELNVEIERSV